MLWVAMTTGGLLRVSLADCGEGVRCEGVWSEGVRCEGVRCEGVRSGGVS